MKNKKHIAILGSTGSIGVQTLEVIDAYPNLFDVEVITANNNADLLIAQAKHYNPNVVVIANDEKYETVKFALKDTFIKVFAGEKALSQVVEMQEVDIVLTALVGFVGLLPTINAINAGKQIALANKETLVVAGHIISEISKHKSVKIIPVDSEHSAIFQCLVGETNNKVEKIYLTASGGPFRGKDAEFLANITKKEALKHPNWEMGQKITIDSATMMNKGLEVIEAKWLFDLKHEQIDVIVHPQSIVHSLVQFDDGSLKAQMGLPDMKLPIHYALHYPNRMKTKFPRFNFLDYPNLTFEKADFNVFRNLQIAYDAMINGGNTACVMNAANEIAVAAFLQDKIKFLQISDVIEKTINRVDFMKNPNIEDLLVSDKIARKIALEFL